eukprot:1190324-Prorocentrum_minimum.AAC.1
MQDAYQAYNQVFLTAGASSSAEVRALLKVLLAVAQEPLPQSLLQRTGLGASLQPLPGWGVRSFCEGASDELAGPPPMRELQDCIQPVNASRFVHPLCRYRPDIWDMSEVYNPMYRDTRPV